MAKISAYTDGGAPAAADKFIVARSGTNKSILWSAITAIFAPIAKGVTNGDSHDHIGGDGAAIAEGALSLSDVTTGNASTTKHGLVVKATAPAATLRNIVAIDNGETAYTNKALFDATAVADLGATSATGSQMAAARRDHVHGRAKVAYNPTWTGLDALKHTSSGYYVQIGDLIVGWAKAVMTDTTPVTGTVSFTLPVNCSETSIDPLGVVILRDTGTAQYSAVAFRNAAGSALIRVLQTDGTYASQAVLAAAVPFTWTTNDEILVQYTYLA